MDQEQVLGALALLGTLQSANTRLRQENMQLRQQLAKKDDATDTSSPKKKSRMRRRSRVKV